MLRQKDASNCYGSARPFTSHHFLRSESPGYKELPKFSCDKKPQLQHSLTKSLIYPLLKH